MDGKAWKVQPDVRDIGGHVWILPEGLGLVRFLIGLREATLGVAADWCLASRVSG